LPEDGAGDPFFVNRAAVWLASVKHHADETPDLAGELL